MQSIQQELDIGPTEDSARIDHCAEPDTRIEASRLKKIGIPPPPPVPKRWVPQKKAEIVAAVHRGFITLDDACTRYALSIEEYLTWQRAIDLFGLAGLRMNKTQLRRNVRTRATDHRLDDTR